VRILVTGGAGYIGSTVTGIPWPGMDIKPLLRQPEHGRRDLLPAGVELIEAR